MGHDDGHIRLLGGVDLLHPAGEVGKILVDGIRGNLFVHDGVRIVGNIADQRNAQSRFLYDHIVSRKGDALLRVRKTEIAGQNRDFRIAGKIADPVGRERGVSICTVCAHAPVKLMIAQRHGVIVHGIQRGDHGSAHAQIPDRHPLIDVAAVNQQHIVVLPAGTGFVYDLGDTGKPILKLILFSAGGVQQIAVNIAGFKDADGPLTRRIRHGCLCSCGGLGKRHCALPEGAAAQQHRSQKQRKNVFSVHNGLTCLPKV